MVTTTGQRDFTLTEPAPAKINLYLDITGRRPDGYHTITGVMQTVDLMDAVRLSVTGAGERSGELDEGGAKTISLSCSDPSLPTDSRNLAWKAAVAFFAETNCRCEHLSLHVDKRIPSAAGMAGGSSDAAAVLRALNNGFGHPLTRTDLIRVGARLGADIPFCIVGGAQVTEGIGEVLTACPRLFPCEIVAACAGEGVSTPAAYGKLDELYGNFVFPEDHPATPPLAGLLRALEGGKPETLAAHLFNLFESAVLPTHSMAGKLRRFMTDHGAFAAMMSGSGPSVFGLFPAGDPAAKDACAILQNEGIPAWTCRPL